MTSQHKAFEGILVLDLTQGVAGPHSTMLLAQHGADVVKIEPPEGDWGRGLGEIQGDHCAHSIAFNRGKRSIAIDLKSPKGLEVVKTIAAKANIVIESFRPGVIKRLGLGYDDIKAINPNVIYASVSGFGQTGPNNKRPTVDGLIQAFSGMMVMNRTAEGWPHRQGMIAVDVTTGLYVFNALSAALMRQLRFNEGSHLDLSLMQSAAAWQGAKLMEYVWSNGTPPPLYMPAGTFKTADGHIVLSAMRPHHFRKLFELVGREDVANDPTLQTHDDRIRGTAKIMKALNEAMPAKKTEEWIELLQAQEVFCERVNNYADYLEHPHVKAVGAVDWVEQPGSKRLPFAQIPGLPPARETDPRLNYAPHISENCVEILRDFGYAQGDVDALFQSKAVFPPAPVAKAAE